MLKSLHLKNWRSIREATIEFTPITVLIGANASGKTNVLDALYFLRDIINNPSTQVVYQRGGGDKIRTLGVNISEATQLDYSYKLPNFETVINKLELRFLENKFQFMEKHVIYVGQEKIVDSGFIEPPQTHWSFVRGDKTSEIIHNLNLMQFLSGYPATRWQLLTENFMPPLSVATNQSNDIYDIKPDATNTVVILDFMKLANSTLYKELQEDLRFLLGHVSHISSKMNEHEVQVAFHENKYPEKEAPTVSAGTARILAILAAIYALDMRNPEMPGLIVIEEPETSLNPSLLKKFVELLRGYTEDTEKPRQFILTTHNPAFLNYFQPEEVRVVSRDEDGNTVVNPVPDYIRDIWLDEHGLGDVWLTNAFGGVAE